MSIDIIWANLRTILSFALEQYIIFLIINGVFSRARRVFDMDMIIIALAAGFAQHFGSLLITNNFPIYHVFLLLFTYVFSLRYDGTGMIKVTWCILSVALHFMCMHVATIVIGVATGLEVYLIYSSFYPAFLLKLFSNTAMLILALIIRRFTLNVDFELPRSFRLSFLMIAIIIYLLEFLLIAGAMGTDNHISLNNIYFSVSYMLIFFITYYMYLNFAKVYNENLKASLSRQQLHYTNNHYEDISALYKDMRVLRHDLLNHISCMNILLQKQDYNELQHYFQDLLEENVVSDRWIECGNHILNAVLNNKYQEAAKYGIQMDVEAVVPSRLSVADSDLCAIFANLLDNAIEGSRSAEFPVITVRVRPEKNYLSILIRNSTKDNVRTHNPLLKTTKTYAAHAHGLGLGIVNNLIDKYDGDREIITEDNQFIYSAMIKVGQSAKAS